MKNKKNPFAIQRIGRPRKFRKNSLKIHGALKTVGFIFLTLGLMAFVYFSKEASQWFRASIIAPPEPFSGTVMPVEKTVNWTQWQGDSATAAFDSVPENQRTPLPPYDLAMLAFPMEKLEWGNPAHEIIRNTLITYSVVYLGSYKENHTEGTGSHLAVDIKMLSGTPVRAIANGQVVKASAKESGFGHHVVIKHIGVPDPDQPGSTTTLYSAYNHLSDVLVNEGQNVLKGEMIAKSGNTGTSTTPHLHLQIDKDSAPWHPYWPFTWTEAKDAGLSFFEAVNAGLGLAKARENTVNPMPFIMEYLDYDQAVHQAASPAPSEPPVETVPAETPAPVTPAEPSAPVTPENPAAFDASLFEFELRGEEISLINSGLRIFVKDHQNQIEKLGENDAIKVQIQGVGEVLNRELKKADFVNDEASVTVKSDQPGSATLIVGKSTHPITFVEQAKNAIALKIEHDGNFAPEAVEMVRIFGVDDQGNLSPNLNFSGEVAILVTTGQALVIPNRLNARDFENGVATVRVKSNGQDPIVLRAQNGALMGESLPINPENPNLFTDVDATHPHYEAIKFLKNESILNGYPDGSFKPEESVNRVEALKMLMLAFDVSPTAPLPLPFPDTEEAAWYAGTLAAALEKAIVKGYPDGTFKPAQTVNRAEYLKILFNSAGLGAEVAELEGKPYDDVNVSDWFAAFAYLANKKNILETDSNLLKPVEGMTRALVAETIYRMKMIQKNGLVSYEK